MFGTAAADTAARRPAESLRETDLNLTLTGVIAERSSNRKLAVIARGNEAERVYWLGDTVAGAEIVRIDAGRVVLRRNGIDEALTSQAWQVQQATRADRRSQPTDDLAIRRVGELEHVVPQASVSDLQSRLPQLLTQARTEPQFDERGAAVGFRIVEVADGSVFSALGFRPEDVIRAVNGTSVRNTEEAIRAYQDLRTSSDFRVDVLRDGRSITLDYTIQ